MSTTDKSNTNPAFSGPNAVQLAALMSVPGVGRVTSKRIIGYLKKAEAPFGYFWDQLPTKYTAKLLSNRQIDSLKKFKKEYTFSSYQEWLDEQEIAVVAYTDREYPPLLKVTTDYPLVLFVKGNTKLLSKREMIAVVGTRKITNYGKIATKKIVSELCDWGAVVVSGFMYGVDVTAHRAALKSDGKTVGILGFGFKHMYPKSHRRFFQSMLGQGGLFISEYPPDTQPNAGQFPVRNRIIAGMSQAVVVIEAAKRSGTTITANCALEEGRCVCAVPGPITSQYSEGTKKLIKNGAVLVSSGSDIISELKRSYPTCWQQQFFGEKTKKNKKTAKKENSAVKKIYGMLTLQSLSTEKLSRQLQLPIVELNTLLTEMELKGTIKREGLYWTIKD